MQFKPLPTLLLGASLLTPTLSTPTTQVILNDAAKNNELEKVKHALKKADIIPTILPDYTPKCFVLPTYTKHSKYKTIKPGKKLKPKKTKKKPSLTVFCPDMQTTTGLTIALTDPDAPSRDDPKWGEMCHWIAPVAEAVRPSFGMFEVEADKVDDLVKYKAPGPPKGTGYHRYVFVLLEGDNTNLTMPDHRRHWGMGKKKGGIREWAEREGLVVVGASYFREKH